MRTLTEDQKIEIKKELIKNGVPVRFLFNGQALNLDDGSLYAKNTNIIHHPVYWNFNKETSKKIANWLGVKAVFSK